MTEQDPYVKELRKQIKRAEKIPLDKLACRRGALSHSWQMVRPDFDTHLKGAIPVARQCTRCLAICRYTVSKQFGEYLSGPSYEYPEGYLDSRGPGDRPLNARAVRAAFVKAAKEQWDDLPDIQMTE